MTGFMGVETGISLLVGLAACGLVVWGGVHDWRTGWIPDRVWLGLLGLKAFALLVQAGFGAAGWAGSGQFVLQQGRDSLQGIVLRGGSDGLLGLLLCGGLAGLLYLSGKAAGRISEATEPIVRESGRETGSPEVPETAGDHEAKEQEQRAATGSEQERGIERRPVTEPRQRIEQGPVAGSAREKGARQGPVADPEPEIEQKPVARSAQEQEAGQEPADNQGEHASASGSLGFGDVKLFAGIGWFLGARAGLAVFCTSFFLAGPILAAGLLSGRIHMRDHVPFGPFIAAGFVLILVILLIRGMI